MTPRSRALTAGLIIVIAGVATQFLRKNLVGVEAPNLAPWGSQLILGYYLSIFVLAVRGLINRFRGTVPARSEQVLLLLMLASMTGDFVLNNVREAGAMRLDASYGPVILWDTVTFFCWLHAVDVADSKGARSFGESWVIATVPVWKLGREFLWMPFDGMKPYIDLVAGDLALVCWLGLWWLRRRNKHETSMERTLAIAVVFGALYFAFAIVEEVAYLAYRPLYGSGVNLLKQMGLPGYSTNFGFIALTTATLLWICWRNPWRLTERLSLRRTAQGA